MKKNLLLIALFFFIVSITSAQIRKGSTFLGGGFSINYTETETNSGTIKQACFK